MMKTAYCGDGCVGSLIIRPKLMRLGYQATQRDEAVKEPFVSALLQPGLSCVLHPNAVD